MSKVNVMVVDDAAFMRMMLKNLLKEVPELEVVQEAENGEVAVEKYKEAKGSEKEIGLVFMDITMPQKDGKQALKEIIDFDKEAVVIMCSAMGAERDVLEAVKLGAKQYIKKPFDQKEAMDIVKDTLEKYK